MKKAGLITISVVVLAIIALIILTQIGAGKVSQTTDLKAINVSDSFDQSEKEYLVYFWQEGCIYCQQIEEDVVQFANDADLPIYLVDMQANQNHSAWYNWDAHHQQYDRVIGKVEDGEEQYFEDAETFLDDSNVNWEIIVDNQDQIIAVHQTAYPETRPSNAEAIEIAGTPTILYIQSGQVTEYAFGTEKALDLLSSLN
ncbi:hypothetical protein [Amphibacillus sediminis]|uniref:hypothetical protein n=1 Tax=Amphibacillus sediminis TaxID=360185 RepID=UPI0008311F51|nr:hypothetical protein [Amphibacillus sediminis]